MDEIIIMTMDETGLMITIDTVVIIDLTDLTHFLKIIIVIVAIAITIATIIRMDIT